MFEIFAWILAFVVAITIHEAAHAYMADRLGDPTPRLMGRLSLNPIVHYDKIGTTLLIVLIFMREFLKIPVIPFGWAKPVQFDPYNLVNPRRDSALISVAGPASNFIVAIMVSIIINLLMSANLDLYAVLLMPTVTLNIILGLFNLLPIHPLDGGKIFVGLLPENEAEEAERFLQQYGFIILLFLILPLANGSPAISYLLGPVASSIVSLLLPNMPSY
ncbi:MAG: site-2 protease family protein [Patescibacteria group bacterium]|nr:site-2 protease family protein [Patescibacteria group bacterium]